MFWMLLSACIEKQVETDIVDTTSSCFVCRACAQKNVVAIIAIITFPL